MSTSLSPLRSEPRNPFYLLLLLASLAFVVTALAYAVVPVLEDKAKQAGQDPPSSPFRVALRADGWKWLLIEVAAIVVLSVLSMGLDRLRRLREDRRQTLKSQEATDTMPPSSPPEL